MESENSPRINVPPICAKHQSLLVYQAKYSPTDPWQSMIVVSNVVLFQAATCDDNIQKKLGGDVKGIEGLGCLACVKPDVFGEIVEAAKTHDIGKVKAIGDRYIEASRAK